MAERIPLVTAEMLNPNIEERSANASLQLVRFMGDYLGRGRLRIGRQLRDGGFLSDYVTKDIDSAVFNSIRGIHQLPDSIDPREFYIQQLKQAAGVRTYFSDLVPEIAQGIEGKNEIAVLSDRPSDFLRLLFRRAGSIDPTLAAEAQQHVLLAHLAGMINARTLNGRLRTVLHDVNRQLTQGLFEGPEGTGKRIHIESFHDDETNQVVGFPHRGDKKPPTAHLKKMPFTVRKVKDLGWVFVSPRKKDDRVAMIKCVAKALNNGGAINIGADIQDGVGFEFVATEDHISPRQLAERVVETIETGKRRVAGVQRGIKQVERDRGQAADFEFDERVKIWLQDIPTSLEMTFFTLANYLDYKLAVGTRDPQTGLYMGRAAELFQLRRAKPVANLLFKKEIAQDDLDQAFINRSKFVAGDLRVRYRVA